jgi:transcriptional regulator with XRE-family HTH domain
VRTLKNLAFIDRLNILIEGTAEGKQKTFAEKLGVRAAVVSKWVKRGSLPSAEQLENICHKLGVNLNWLVAGTGARFLPSAQTGEKPGVEVIDKKALYWGDVEVDLQSVGTRLKQIRGDFTPKMVSDESSAPLNSIKLAERGVAVPDPRHLYWAASYGDTFADWIMTGEGPQTAEETDRLLKSGEMTPDEYALVTERKKGYGQPITPEERDMLNMYRKAPDEGKRAAEAVLSIYIKKSE